jgi:hypothetical protein
MARSFESRRYSIVVHGAKGKLLKVLGRESLVAPVTAAYRAYVEKYSDRLIMLRQAGQTGSSPTSARRSAAVTHPAVPPVLLLLGIRPN